MSKQSSPSKWLTDHQVGAEIGYCRSSVWEFVTPTSPRYRPDFPPGIKLGPRCRRWSRAAVEAYVETLSAQGQQA